MTKYILKTHGKKDRVLFVQTAFTDDWWTVRFHFIVPGKNIDFSKKGNRYRAHEKNIRCGTDKEAVQSQLDAFAQKLKLEIFTQ